ncbi:serine hydrolase domain-containing protein [Marivirga arenosa]|uniref:Serine hydrolase domain-containing protein n=1 Tax=Marivirga arenosa TaxID=3059076 RepID=A0AA51X512_9BACT|nr:serine hydrolase domain-containing protein [Marivirga sp. BKB1-2]WNB16759.1 serine hydrolase domain-containing protein [Marivirga sp. BKB1-2]
MKTLLTLIIFLLISSSGVSQNQSRLITSELEQIYNKSTLVGFGVAILNKDSIVYSKGFGYSNKELEKPYTTNTVQPIASISKTLLGIALMKAQELDLLQLDEAINTYLPFKIYNPRYKTNPITIRQLANHTSSILDSDDYNRIYIFNDSIPQFYKHLPENIQQNVKEDIKRFNNNKMMSASNFIKNQYNTAGIWYTPENFSNNAPGTSYKYSNMGANIAAYIIELVSGASYTDFLQKHILNPLQMNASGWHSKSNPLKNRSTLYWYGYPIPNYEFITYGDGGFMTNIEDFSKFLSAVIKGYCGEQNVIKASSYANMVKDPSNDNFKKNMFWNIDDEKIGHSGNDPGVISHAYFMKKNKRGIIVFANSSETENDMQSVREIYRALLKYSNQFEH